MLCIGVLVVPLLLLATPGRAVSGPERTSAPVETRVTPEPVAPRVQLLVHTDAFQRGRAEVPPAASPTTTETSPTTTTTVAAASAPASDPPLVVAAAAPGVSPSTSAPPTHTMDGEASWYGAPAGTCASPYLPRGSMITVTDDATGASVICLVDDHEDPASGKVLDLAEATFAELADPSAGVIEVTLSW
jgi:rare lipoprotein A (peptidoglycan hydrolase)